MHRGPNLKTAQAFIHNAYTYTYTMKVDTYFDSAPLASSIFFRLRFPITLLRNFLSKYQEVPVSFTGG